ncbi:MAG: ATP-binding protein [Bacteroidia bacterium]|nr:ATP-binding protein [Bacteroidia bacterium]
MIPKIAIVGPESTGKSSLAKDLAAHYDLPWVEEYARKYLENLARPYGQSDLIEIALGQLQLEEKLLANNPSFLICDTNLLVIKIWSEFKYGNADPALEELYNFEEYRHYFLCDTDIAWSFDPLREHPEQRVELFNIYHHSLRQLGLSFSIIRGTKEERLKFAVSEINQRILAK